MSEHCETANTNMYPAIPCLAGDIASGRAEETRSFPQKIYVVNFLWKRINVPCCRRRIWFPSG